MQYHVEQYIPSTAQRSRKLKDWVGFEVKLLLSENARRNSKTRNREKGTKHRLPAPSADGQPSQRRSVDPYL